MNAQATISPSQLSALQSLYSRWQTHNLEGDGDQRSVRLTWASENLGRRVESFKELTSGEAGRLIDVLKGSLGQRISRPRTKARIHSRDKAQAAGTAGRRGVPTNVIHFAGPYDLARIENAVARLGWTQDSFMAWLRSATSPLGRRPDRKIRTVADANRVWWALKALLKRNGKWIPEDEMDHGPQSAPARASMADQGGPAA